MEGITCTIRLMKIRDVRFSNFPLFMRSFYMGDAAIQLLNDFLYIHPCHSKIKNA